MDKRIAICLIAALLILVVTAAYAPDTGTGTAPDSAGLTDDEQAAKDKADAKALQAKIDKLIENQELILNDIKILKENQDLIRQDTKYIRSKVH
jgi:hypothetical protein